MAGPKGAYGIVGLVVVLVLVVAFLPIIRDTFAPVFPEGFRNLDCKGVTCDEGEFCQNNVCKPVMPAITNQYVGYGL
jgi:hypothetical protein